MARGRGKCCGQRDCAKLDEFRTNNCPCSLSVSRFVRLSLSGRGLASCSAPVSWTSQSALWGRPELIPLNDDHRQRPVGSTDNGKMEIDEKRARSRCQRGGREACPREVSARYVDSSWCPPRGSDSYIVDRSYVELPQPLSVAAAGAGDTKRKTPVRITINCDDDGASKLVYTCPSTRQ
jgi:hypothetical protein